MVKAELERDYYADLELQPSADANEIKKAFKKLALKYHPDRNPGRELEFNAKFQSIQSANEILTDPQQRAKYDAQRIRSGYLHTYSNASPSPSRPPVPTRPPASNFPPPPRPPPPPMSKSSAPPPSGAQKYSNVRFNRSEASSPWSSSNTDDSKAKSNDYKAWEQMRTRHGQGPIPAGRTAPPKPPRASTFQPGYEQSSTKPPDSTSRRSGWDRWQEAQAGNPGISRSNTTRPSPKTTGFAPATPGGDEPQAAGSAYFKVSRGERPPTAGHQTQMPPPNAVPTAKKPDPLKAFRDQIGVNEPFGKKQPRTSPRHHRGTGEPANIKSPPHHLHRSATSAAPHDNHRSTGLYDSKVTNAGAAHARATSTHSNHHSMSPPAQRPSKLPGMYSSSSSDSSSDDDAASTSKKPSIPEIRTDHPRASSGQRRPGFNLYAKVEDAGDEKMAPRANVGESGTRRHSAIDLSSDKTPKGFQEHRMEHDAARSQPQSAGGPRSEGSNGAKPSLVRSHSWHDKYKYDPQKKQGSPPKSSATRPSTGSEAANPTMYAIPGYTPFSCSPSSGPYASGTPLSDKWSEQWPFKSPRKPKAPLAQAPPYWAIPSSLPPIKETGQRSSSTRHAAHDDNTKASIANLEHLHSFTMPKYSSKAPNGAQPLRTHSSDNIDTKFSPESYHPRFFDPFPASAASTPLRTVSPTTDSGSQPQWEAADPIAEQGPTRSQDSFASKPPTAMPPPPAAHDKYNPERWAHLNDIQFTVPQSPQARSPSRTSTRKRTWPRGTKFAAAQPKVNDVEDEPTSTDMNGESLNNSNINNDGDAMDIDEPTAPLSSRNAPHTNGADFSPFQTDSSTLNAHRAPALPPRQNAKGYHQPEKSTLHLGDLKGVFPLAPSNEGLGNMQDLAGDLPFESRPSAVNPGQDRTMQRFEFPQPPQYPTNPFSLTSSSCERHGRRIRDYMNEWNKFNSKMVSILTARKTFLHDNSESDVFDIQDKGFDDYMDGLKQLQRARIHYEIACEHHEKSMQDLSSLRQEMKRGRGPG